MPPPEPQPPPPRAWDAARARLQALELRAARLAVALRARLAGDDGYTTEQVIITAVLATLAIAVGAIITKIVLNWANSIGGPGG